MQGLNKEWRFHLFSTFVISVTCSSVWCNCLPPLSTGALSLCHTLDVSVMLNLSFLQIGFLSLQCNLFMFTWFSSTGGSKVLSLSCPLPSGIVSRKLLLPQGPQIQLCAATKLLLAVSLLIAKVFCSCSALWLGVLTLRLQKCCLCCLFC